MYWLSFLIGALAGWLASWLIDYLICRPRRRTAEASLNAKLQECDEECAALRAQLTGYQDLQVRLDGANFELATLKAQAAGMNDLQVRLDGANSQVAGLQARLDGANVELDSLRAQVGGLKDVQLRSEVANTQIDALKEQLAKLKGAQADLISWKARATEQGLEIERLNTELAARVGASTAAVAAGAVAAADVGVPAVSVETEAVAPAIPTAEADVALTALAAQPVEPDDLTLIEGIGPKISALLNQNDVYSFAQLAAAGVQQLQSILSSGGPHFRLADPQTWPEQAQLARDGKWDELKALQDTLTRGRRV
jgi:predicted flap endonuclease-1-like 5' DNA nuclease